MPGTVANRMREGDISALKWYRVKSAEIRKYFIAFIIGLLIFSGIILVTAIVSASMATKSHKGMRKACKDNAEGNDEAFDACIAQYQIYIDEAKASSSVAWVTFGMASVLIIVVLLSAWRLGAKNHEMLFTETASTTFTNFHSKY